MNPDVLRKHIQRCKAATAKPFGVNVPLLFSHAESFMHIIVEEQVPVVFTSAGSPAKYTSYLHESGIKVAHVIANTKFARKCEEAGVDAIVAEGYEAGGHNGIEETTSMTLIPMIRKAVRLPLIAAGGIATGGAMAAAFALGAEGVQVGTRFAASTESSAHAAFKEKMLQAQDGDTLVMMKKLVPVRLLRNKFFMEVWEAEMKGASKEELLALLGKGRAAKGMFEGDIEEGELEVGQVAGLIHEIKPAGHIVADIIREFYEARTLLNQLNF
jgi:enoyl-[acyl-carrier protein] reductase II